MPRLRGVKIGCFFFYYLFLVISGKKVRGALSGEEGDALDRQRRSAPHHPADGRACGGRGGCTDGRAFMKMALSHYTDYYEDSSPTRLARRRPVRPYLHSARRESRISNPPPRQIRSSWRAVRRMRPCCTHTPSQPERALRAASGPPALGGPKQAEPDLWPPSDVTPSAGRREAARHRRRAGPDNYYTTAPRRGGAWAGRGAAGRPVSRSGTERRAERPREGDDVG